ncbi:unnamed protein product, partial [Scytosiphon promiscuus]
MHSQGYCRRCISRPIESAVKKPHSEGTRASERLRAEKGSYKKTSRGRREPLRTPHAGPQQNHRTRNRRDDKKSSVHRKYLLVTRQSEEKEKGEERGKRTSD